MKTETKTILEHFRKYLGPSANGQSDAVLKKLAGWTTFQAAWSAAKTFYGKRRYGFEKHT